MQVKRFVAENMRLALNMVREEVGADAVILSNKRVDEGVEILIALDPEGHLTGSSTKSHSVDVPRDKNRAEGLSINPFLQETAQQQKQEQPKEEPSKLEIELERMQRDARERARMLAASLNGKQSLSKSLTSNLTENLEPGSVTNKDLSLKHRSKMNSFKQLLAGAADEKHKSDVDGLADDVVKVASAKVVNFDSQETNQASSMTEHIGGSSSNKRFDHNTDEELAHMRSELQVMRDMMEQQLSSMAWGQYTQKTPEKASLWRRLKRIGIDASLSNKLLDLSHTGKDNRAIWQNVMTELSHCVPVIDNDLVAGGGVFAFVGPTGAGKTTTIGKLAAQYVLKNGSSDIALVSTDTARIAAYEQLRTFGRILNVTVKIVDSQNSLEKVLHSLRDKSLVMIDTSGFNRQDPRLVRQQKSIEKLGRRVTSLLVLPTTSQGQVLKAAYHTYKTDNLKSCVVTKLDEAMSLGEVISLCAENSLAIAYSTDGQNVPDDITPGNGQALVAKAIKLAQKIDIDNDAMISDLAIVSKAGI